MSEQRLSKEQADQRVTCDYCGKRAAFVTGQVVYPHRPDLYAKLFYRCAPCDAMVGCHPGTSTPLGRLADAELRRAKQSVHAVFDPIWQARWERKSAVDPKYKKNMARNGRYRRLAELMGIPREECHVGMFDVERCRRAVEIIKSGALEREEPDCTCYWASPTVRVSPNCPVHRATVTVTGTRPLPKTVREFVNELPHPTYTLPPDFKL